MNFLRKILLIAIISFNTEIIGAVLDLPGGAMGTPGLQGPRQNKMVNGINSSCYHIIVPNTAADNARNGQVNNAARTRAMAANGNIYFPRNGVQPTTPEAVEYSCANIDNRENSPITEWYMQMFGVIPFQNAGAPGPNDYIKAGWDDAGLNARQIINFDGTMINDPDTPGQQISRLNLFKREFRKIASTSVGRVLLYRILIEIRRHNPGNNAGVTQDNIQIISGIDVRNLNRSINITWGSYAFYEHTAKIKVNFDPPVRITVIGKKYSSYSYIATDPSSHDINIFHEMNHWYHQLRHPDRQRDETSIDLNQCNNFSGYFDYWGQISGTVAERSISMTPWIGRYRDTIAGEEIRNILGKRKRGTSGQNTIHNTYFEGDDLSENLYRACIGKPLRFGHGLNAFYEDNRVVDIVVNVTATNIVGYFSIENPLYRNQKTFDKGYRPPYNRRGLGDSYHK